MEIHHIYVGEDGKSRMKMIDVPMEPLPNGRGTVSQMLAGSGVYLRTMPPNMLSDWHTAPRKQIVCTIAGEGELETGDGQVMHIKPGTMELLEDTHGQGHITRGRGAIERVCLFLPLDDETVALLTK